MENCKTSNGAYAVYAGAEEVDLLAALFVPFGFDDAESDVMRATIAALEKITVIIIYTGAASLNFLLLKKGFSVRDVAG